MKLFPRPAIINSYLCLQNDQADDNTFKKSIDDKHKDESTHAMHIMHIKGRIEYFGNTVDT